MARLFYTLDTTGDLDRLDAEVFSAIHQKGLKVSEKAIADWAVSQGVDAQRFSEAWNSVQRRQQGQARRRSGHANTVFRVFPPSSSMAAIRSAAKFEEMLKLTDQVIDMPRRAQWPGSWRREEVGVFERPARFHHRRLIRYRQRLGAPLRRSGCRSRTGCTPCRPSGRTCRQRTLPAPQAFSPTRLMSLTPTRYKPPVMTS